MEIEEVIRKRRSIRKYRSDDIADSVIRELLDLARHAPSSMNGQPWHFIVVRDPRIKKELTKIKNRYCPIEKRRYKADFLQKASAIIVVCVDRQKSYDRGIENAVLAAANIMLGAANYRIGSVYMSAYKSDTPELAEEIRRVLGIPEGTDPITIVPLGFPGETPKPKKIRSLLEMISYDIFGKR